MVININEARHIARYLYLGAFERGNREICISIGDKAEIGVKKHVNGKYALFVKKDNKIDKKAGVPAFSKSITNDDLARLVVDIIGNSVFLIDTELDMKKVPIIPANADTSKQEEVLEDEGLTLDDFEEEYVPKESSTTPVDEDVEEEPEEELESEDLEEELEETPEELDLDESEESEEDKEDEEETNDEPEETTKSRMRKYLGDDDPLLQLTEEEINAMFDDDDPKVYYEKIDVDGEEAILIGDPNFDYPNDSDMDYIDIDDLESDDSDEEKDSSDDQQNVLVQKTRHKHITNNSYLVQVMGDNKETLDRMTKVNERLIALDKGKATELYVRGLTALVSLYDNDIEHLAKDIKIDERDIILALYEGQYCNC